MSKGTYDHILHLDIKPSNILLGYEQPHDPARTGGLYNEQIQSFANENDLDLPVYPSIKLADFGLAYYASHANPIEAERIRGGGTDGYIPPVRLAKLIRPTDS